MYIRLIDACFAQSVFLNSETNSDAVLSGSDFNRAEPSRLKLPTRCKRSQKIEIAMQIESDTAGTAGTYYTILNYSVS